MLLVFLILLAGALPYGGVALWAQTLIGLLCMGLAIAVLYPRKHREHPPAPPVSRVFRVFAGWVALGTGVHCVNALLLRTAGCLPDLSSAIFLWCAWSLLAVSVRHLSGNPAHQRLLFTGIALLATAQALLGIVGLYTPLGIYGKFVNGSRAAGTFSSGNSMGGFLALSLPPTLAMAQTAFVKAFAHIRRRRQRILHHAVREDYCLLTALLWLMAALVQSIALLLSGSRGAITAALVATICLCTWFMRNRDLHHHADRIPAAAALLTALLVLALGAGGTYAITIGRLQQLEAVQQTAMPRTQIWSGVFQLIGTQPLLGVGPGCFSEAFPRYQPEGYGGGRVYHAHNDYLELAAETGLPGLFLLLLAFGILLFSTARRLLAPQSGESAWFQRAALLSVIAGLIHAVVDFNISSRPGVAALFFCLLGVALAREHQLPLITAEPPRRHDYLRRWSLCLFCALLALNQIRLATANILVEHGFTAITGNASLYFWLPTPSLSTGNALKRLQAACRLAPESGEASLYLARALVAASDQRIEQAIASAQKDNSGVPPQTVARQVRVLMRLDEHIQLTLAGQHVERALRRSPANSDAAAQDARITARLTALDDEPGRITAGIQKTLSSIRRAREQAPNDATVHRTLINALAQLAPAFSKNIPILAMQAEVQAMSIAIGSHLLQLGDSRLDDILTVWEQLRVDPLKAFDDAAGAPPVDVAWDIYQYYNLRRMPAEAPRALDMLEHAIHSKTISRKGFREASQAAEIIANFQRLLIRERARWNLRRQRFDDYRAAADQHKSVLNQEITQALSKTKAQDAAAQRFRYLKLLELYDKRGLDQMHAEELASLMRQLGESETAIGGVLKPYAPATTGDRLASNGFPADIVPDNHIAMQLLGGRIELIGFSIRENTILTFWRFHSTVPSDLQSIILFRDHTDATVASASFRFTQVFGREFGVGTPSPGLIFQAATAIPPAAVLSENLIIGMQRLSSPAWLPSLEGLPYCEIDQWPPLRKASTP